MKIALLDIESTKLDADVGHVLCVCAKTLGRSKPVVTFRIDHSPHYRRRLWDDSKVCSDVYTWLYREDPDLVVTFNGKRFDFPYLNSRLLAIRHRPLPPVRHVDHFETGRFKLRLHNLSMDTMARHLGLPIQKTFYDAKVWDRASHGSKQDLDKIVFHCKKDVLVLEQLHERVTPLLRSLRSEIR